MIDAIELVMGARVWLQHASLILLALAAYRFGAAPERGMAAVYIGMVLADLFYHAAFGLRVELVGLDIGHFLIDAFGFVAMAVIALYANRMYTLWVAAFQLLALGSHLARIMAPQMSPIAYATMKIAPSYFVIGLLAAGIWMHHRRQRRFGRYNSWSSSLPHWLRTVRMTLRKASLKRSVG